MAPRSGPLEGYHATAVSVSMSGGPSSDIVSRATKRKTSEDGEGEGDVSSLESIPVGVRERPKSSNVIGIGSSQHCGSRHPMQVVPVNNTTLRSSTSSGSLVEEEEVSIRKRPTAFGSPKHGDPPPKSVDQTRGSQTQHRPTSTHTTQLDDRIKVASSNVESTSTSKPRSDNACGEAQRVASQSIGNKKWCTDDDSRILRDMWEASHQQKLVGLISPQRPGVLGYLDKVTGLVTGRQESLTDADFGYRIHFGDLQRIHIQFLHSKVVNLAVSSHFHDSEWKSGGKAEQIGQVLKEYIQAVKDHEYMAKYAKATDDPFIATSQRLYDKKFLESAMTAEGDKMPEDFLPQQPPQYETRRQLVELLKKHAVPTGPWERDNTDKPAAALISTRTKAWKRAYWTRIGAAVIGGAFLIAPMWILALQQNLFVHLGVATGCITAFGFSMSLYLETVDGVFAATLAYAAVIMVFVGIVIQEIGSNGA